MASDYQNYTPEQYDGLIANLGAAFQESSGFEREKLSAQIQDAQKARQNAASIAKLQASTSIKVAKIGAETSIKVANIGAQTQRYGIDVGRQNILDQLKENARQYDANHALDMERFGLDKQRFGEQVREFDASHGLDVEKLGEQAREFDLGFGLDTKKLGLEYAKTAADYLSTPDRYFQAGDYLDMASRAIRGPQPPEGGLEFANQSGPQPLGTIGSAPDNQIAPTPKTSSDFAALAGFDLSGTGTPSGGAPAAAGDRAPGPASSVPANATAADPRLKALQSIFTAVPPSSGAGMDGNDWAVLNAAKALISTRLPGTLERMSPGQRAITVSAAKRLGYDPQEYLTDYQRSGVGQGSNRLA